MLERKDKSPGTLSGAAPNLSAVISDVDRRQFCRYPFTATAEVTEVRSQTRVMGRSSDIGSGGCYIDTMAPHPVGAVVSVQITHEQRKFEAVATVSYAHQSMGMGLAFTEIKPKDRTLLQEWIAQLSGQPVVQIAAPPVAVPQPAVPQIAEQQPAEPEADAFSEIIKLRQVVNELISLMVRKRIIDQKEGANLLQQIFR